MAHSFSFSFRNLTPRADASPRPSPHDPQNRDLATFSHRRLKLALGPFRRRVRHVEAILRDLNGPRGGIDKACTVRVHLEPSDLLVVESRSGSDHAAIADAARRASAAVRRRLHRRRAVVRNRLAAEPWRRDGDRRTARRDERTPQLVG
jgi:hypothetical protein